MPLWCLPAAPLADFGEFCGSYTAARHLEGKFDALRGAEFQYGAAGPVGVRGLNRLHGRKLTTEGGHDGFDRGAEGLYPVGMKPVSSPRPLPVSIDATVALLAEAQYLGDRSLGTVLYLALKMGRRSSSKARPASARPRSLRCCADAQPSLIRLQCYEGIDIATRSMSRITRGR